MRELYFTSIFDSEVDSVEEKAARAGLACLKAGYSGDLAGAIIEDVRKYDIDIKESFLGKYTDGPDLP